MRKQYAGNAAAATLDGPIAASGETTLRTSAATGWPLTGPYVLVIDRGGETEEKILIASRTSDVHTIQERGYDGTTAIAHSDGATVEHCLDAATLDEANAHVNLTTRDDHTQYLNELRHRTIAYHQFGGALEAPGDPAPIGTIANPGSDTAAAREDHVHIIGPEAISASTMFAAGAVDNNALAQDAVDTINIVDESVTAAKIAPNSLGPDQITAGSLTETELAASVAGSGLSGGAGTALAVNVDGSTIEISTDTLQVKAGGITDTQLQDVPFCSANRTDTLSVPDTTWTAVNLTAADDWDFSDPMHDTSTNSSRITIPTGWSGKYEIIVRAQLEIVGDTGTTNWFGIGVAISGLSTTPDEILNYIPIANENYDPVLNGQISLSLNANQYVQLCVFHGSGGNPRYIKNCTMQVRYLRP